MRRQGQVMPLSVASLNEPDTCLNWEMFAGFTTLRNSVLTIPRKTPSTAFLAPIHELPGLSPPLLEHRTSLTFPRFRPRSGSSTS